MPAPRSIAETDWARIVALYDLLMQAEPSPVVELNRAAAIAERDGPAAGLALIDAILDAASSATTTPPMRRAPSSAGGLAGPPMLLPPTTGRCRLPSRSRPGIFWKSAGASWTSSDFFSADAALVQDVGS